MLALPPEPLLIPGLVIAPPAAVMSCKIESIDVAPDARISSAPITVTGLAVSISARLIREPVISIRSTSCAEDSAAATLVVENNGIAAAIAKPNFVLFIINLFSCYLIGNS